MRLTVINFPISFKPENNSTAQKLQHTILIFNCHLYHILSGHGKSKPWILIRLFLFYG